MTLAKTQLNLPLEASKSLVTFFVSAAVSNMVSAQDAIVSDVSGATPQIEQISVIGQFVPDEKRETSAVSNVVGEQQFTRTGDPNLAESLKRVSGLSTVAGKYVYVRGLGERYSSTLLNGAALPSPEPINRVVPLDLFPTAVLESVLVQKTYSAQFPSEFGGGVLQLRTKKSTDEFFWNMSSSLGFSQDVSFEDGLTIAGGDTDWLGFDDGYRAIPDLLAAATANGQELKRQSQFLGGKGYTPQQLETIGESLRNEYNVNRESLPANVNFATSLGNYHDIGDNGIKLNYLAALNYSNTWDSKEIERNSYKASNFGLELDDDLDFFGTEHSIDASGIFTAGIDFNKNHNIRGTSVLLRKTDDIVSELDGALAAEIDVRISEIEWIERELLSNQIQGDHYFPDFNELAINWRYSSVTADRDSPDYRRYRYDLINDNYQFSTRADGNVRRYSALEDKVDDFGIDLSMVFYGPANTMFTAQAGYIHTEKNRESAIRRYSFFDQGRLANDPKLLVMPLEDILTPANIQPEGFELREFTRPTDNYSASNESDAVYLQGEINFDDRFRFSAGVRNEEFQQNVTTFDLFRDDVAINAAQNSDDLLPALTATYTHYDHQFRLAYSETLSRPDFRELSPAAFTNPITGFEVVGNPDLEITSIKNYDFRWEWYFSFSDYLSLGLFYKQFDKPIEAVVQPGADKRRTFANATAGENIGIEAEIYKGLGFLGSRWEDFYLQSNVTFIDSEVDIAEADRGVLTNTSRPLQGQSDWLFNAQLGYEPISGVTATLLYHYFGERITQVGTSGAPDLIEQPFGELNFIYIHELNENWKMTLKASNLLNQASEIRQGPLLATGYELGRDISLRVDYKF